MDGTMVTTAAPAATNFAVGNLTFGEGVLYAILGMLVVFFALVLLMVIIKILVKATDKKAVPAAEAPAPVEEAPAPVKRDDPAPGTAGDIKLYTTDPKDAAMIMAIVADTLGKPLNELRFKSIREIKG